jgi:hypothetical protein
VRVRDIVGARLFEDYSHTAILGIHYGIHQPSDASSRAAQVHELFEPLGHASRLHIELRDLGWRSSAAIRALDQLAAGIFITRGDRRIVELNQPADGIIRRNDGLTIRNGKLRALRAFEDAKLGRLSPARSQWGQEARPAECWSAGGAVEPLISSA